MAEHWKAEENRHFRNRDHMSGHIIRFDPTPEPRKNADGTTSLGLRIPALVITHYVDDPAKAAQDIADALNSADAKDKRIAELEAQLAAASVQGRGAGNG
ncbi:hypothetical protein [Aureimonas ureilytica]|uniref:hypothetical protein n=1 Tax=Aureimonas ureilytica TaxID=401562 RepID=UPI000379D349|nr:hypothetical protein [Aureimonas ureilytica]